MNNLTSLVDQYQLKYINLAGELLKLQSKFEINNFTNQIKFNYIKIELKKYLNYSQNFNLTLII